MGEKQNSFEQVMERSLVQWKKLDCFFQKISVSNLLKSTADPEDHIELTA